MLKNEEVTKTLITMNTYLSSWRWVYNADNIWRENIPKISTDITMRWNIDFNITQPAITCSKLTIKTPLASFWYLYCQLWTYFTPYCSVSVVNFEQVNVGWEIKLGSSLAISWRGVGSEEYTRGFCQTFFCEVGG